jgi:hypothetical protein
MKSNVVKDENISSAKAMQDIINKNTKEDEAQAQINQQDGLTRTIESLKTILPSFNIETKDLSEIFNLEDSKRIYYYYY